MAVTQESLRKRVRALIYGALPTARPYQDVLQSNITSSGTSMVVLDGTRWAENDVVDFPNGDQAIVVGVAANTLTIRRGANATAHSTGDVIYKNPRFSTEAIDYAIDSVIQDLFPDIYKITTVSVTYDPQTEWYPINNDNLMEVLTIYYEDHDYLEPRALPVWRQSRGVDATEFGAAQGVFIPHSGGMHDGDTLYIVFRERIDAVDDLLDRQEHLVALGAAYQLLQVANVARTHDPGRWTDRTVQPGQEGRDAIHFLRDFSLMRRREELRLMKDEDRLPKNPHAERARRFRL